MEFKNKELNSIINLVDTKYFNQTTGILTIPEGVETINGEFYYRRKDVNKLNRIKGIKIPNSVEKIGKYAFRRTGITNIELPESVKEIELGAFELCLDLIEVCISGRKVPLVEKDSFIACINLEKFYNNLGDIDIKNDFRISNKAFSTCYKLISEQNKWLMVIPEKESKFTKYVNRILKALTSLLKLNGEEYIKNKF